LEEGVVEVEKEEEVHWGVVNWGGARQSLEDSAFPRGAWEREYALKKAVFEEPAPGGHPPTLYG
jgi:hypothetical protein